MNPKIYLAPMSGVTDLAFRLISRGFGAELCFLEMLDVKAVLCGSRRNERFLKTSRKDSPLAAQLVGADPYEMLEAARKLTALLKLSFLDVNSACPARKVIKKAAGAALLKDTERLGKIVRKLSCGLKIPVTVKLRTGFHEKDVKRCVKAAKVCQNNGASAVFIHGRTTLQGYSGGIDYESIKAVKDALKIPVFGSGNIFTPLEAKMMLDKTGCDGILVARGAFGNPWIFKNIKKYLKTGKLSKRPSLSAKKKVLKRHLAYIEKYKDMSAANKIGFMNKTAMWYFKGFRGAPRINERIHRVKSYKELLSVIGGLEKVLERGIL